MKQFNSLIDPHEMTDLIERYFEGLTSEAEELQLKRFLSTCEGGNPDYDEVRAVMSYAAIRPSTKRSTTVSTTASHRRMLGLLTAAAAGLALFLTLKWYIPPMEANRCAANFYGREVTETAVVMTEVETTLASFAGHGSALNVERDLEVLFSTH